MPHKRIILTNEDTQSLLHFADSIGLLLLTTYMDDDVVRTKKPEELRSFARGTILLYRPEWVVDGIRLMLLDAGPNAGKYAVCYGTNFSCIDLGFSGDEDIAGVRHLGSGGISFRREWLHHKEHEMRPAPPAVEQVYKQVCKHLLSRVFVKGGGHRYYVCKHAAELAARIETLPPFDYIPWPPADLHKKIGR